ncbi:hypothetical protein GCM10011613_15780 [Cellvibrio zantedeschiae]|uniref:OB-fold nucleic acid binding domain-containing protein n=1 Tax=Cellvibrio zantedeschiae TaxID=1237077 RepID=A0ABQ3AZ47_9GAMM|nr:DUF6152 family protein [Cellvibrio zantedeschiae]GGY71753.1 hypothetical protein GCM10011613_15780 [Cellvibrio zantedeschiae]
MRSFVTKNFALAVATTALLGSSLSANAHHAFSAEFDAQKPVELTGVVTKGQWVNPHSWIFVDVKNAKGEIENWGFEFGAPFSLKQKGLTKNTLPIGTEIKLKGYLAKNGEKFAYSTSITLPDGRVFQTGGAQDAPGTPAGTAAQ